MIKPSILLVDDDEITNFLCKKMLSDLDIDSVDSVVNGQEALKYLRKSCPDIIFLDIKMPVMDGFELLEELKKSMLCQQTKIIMLTSSSREKEKQQALAYDNVVDFIVKPLTKASVAKVFDKV